MSQGPGSVPGSEPIGFWKSLIKGTDKITGAPQSSHGRKVALAALILIVTVVALSALGLVIPGGEDILKTVYHATSLDKIRLIIKVEAIASALPIAVLIAGLAISRHNLNRKHYEDQMRQLEEDIKEAYTKSIRIQQLFGTAEKPNLINIKRAYHRLEHHMKQFTNTELSEEEINNHFEKASYLVPALLLIKDYLGDDEKNRISIINHFFNHTSQELPAWVKIVSYINTLIKVVPQEANSAEDLEGWKNHFDELARIQETHPILICQSTETAENQAFRLEVYANTLQLQIQANLQLLMLNSNTTTSESQELANEISKQIETLSKIINSQPSIKKLRSEDKLFNRTIMCAKNNTLSKGVRNKFYETAKSLLFNSYKTYIGTHTQKIAPLETFLADRIESDDDFASNDKYATDEVPLSQAEFTSTNNDPIIKILRDRLEQLQSIKLQ